LGYIRVRAISVQDFQPVWSQFTNVTVRQTTCHPNTTLCTTVHRAVTMKKELIILMKCICWFVCRLLNWKTSEAPTPEWHGDESDDHLRVVLASSL